MEYIYNTLSCPRTEEDDRPACAVYTWTTFYIANRKPNLSLQYDYVLENLIREL